MKILYFITKNIASFCFIFNSYFFKLNITILLFLFWKKMKIPNEEMKSKTTLNDDTNHITSNDICKKSNENVEQEDCFHETERSEKNDNTSMQ